MTDDPTLDITALAVKLAAEFGEVVPGYYINALVDVSRAIDLRGRRVLEIGGSSLPRKLLFEFLGVSKWVCVDLLDHASGRYQTAAQADHYKEVGVRPLAEATSALGSEAHLIYDGSASELPSTFDGKFDVVLSVNSFEHIADLEGVLECVYSSLVPGGTLFSQFGPIWSCRVGSHFWVNDGFNFNASASMPDWAHLRYSQAELRSILRIEGRTDEEIHHACYQIFESDFVNRRFYEDYDSAMRQSCFETYSLEPLWDQPPSPELHAEFRSKFEKYQNFSAYGIRILGKRAVLQELPLNSSGSQIIFGLHLGLGFDSLSSVPEATGQYASYPAVIQGRALWSSFLSSILHDELHLWTERRLWTKGTPILDVFEFARALKLSPSGGCVLPPGPLISNLAHIVLPCLDDEDTVLVLFTHPSIVVSRTLERLVSQGSNLYPSIDSLFETWCDLYEYIIHLAKFRKLRFFSERSIAINEVKVQEGGAQSEILNTRAFSRRLRLSERTVYVWQELKQLEQASRSV